MNVREARARYFADNGFSEASYSDGWVKAKVGPIPICFPNSSSRKRAIPIHDLHHVATGYATTWTGEAEIGAWEIGGGCANYWAAWGLNFGAMALGLVIAPRRTLRAFRQGRATINLYQSGWDDSLLDLSVDELRARLAIAEPAAR
ncbi:MAG: hypothetical protein H0T42_31210 [Deltaproteobacteria bacterium]|nr:hypothetical protein [Deltaproteobacteria bacterium]